MSVETWYVYVSLYALLYVSLWVYVPHVKATTAVLPSNRNPDHAVRPSAKHIAQELRGTVLKPAISKDTPSVLPAFALGAPLEEGRAWYQDLQTKYS